MHPAESIIASTQDVNSSEKIIENSYTIRREGGKSEQELWLMQLGNRPFGF